MYTPIRSILKLPQCKRLRLLAGEEGLDRRVSWARAVEKTVSNESIFKGELVFITGTPGRDDGLEFMKDTLKRLEQNKAAGLVVNTGIYGLNTGVSGGNSGISGARTGKDEVRMAEDILQLADSLKKEAACWMP